MYGLHSTGLVKGLEKNLLLLRPPNGGYFSAFHRLSPQSLNFRPKVFLFSLEDNAQLIYMVAIDVTV